MDKPPGKSTHSPTVLIVLSGFLLQTFRQYLRAPEIACASVVCCGLPVATLPEVIPQALTLAGQGEACLAPTARAPAVFVISGGGCTRPGE
jgi:hypothetical protein